MGKIEYYTTFRWMREELHLAGTELECYAVIYSLSLGDNWYMAGVKNMVQLLERSEPTIISALKNLTDKGLIVKEPVVINNTKRNYYKAKRTFDEQETTLNNLSTPTLNYLSTPTLNNLSGINKINNKEIKERLSNDNHKKTENGFDLFWETYGYKRDKKKSQRIWSKLNAADRKAALAAIPDYKRDCQEQRRQMRYPSVYLNNRTWEDEFTVHADEEPTDEMPAGMTREKWMKIQDWMEQRLPRIWKYIDVDSFLSMEGKSGGDKFLQRDIMVAIDRSTYEGDMVEEFERLRWTEEFKNRLPSLQ